MSAQGVITCAHRQTHEPMFKRRFTPEAGELLKGFGPDFLDHVFHFAFAPRVSAGGGEKAWRVLPHQRLKTGDVAFEHCRDQIRIRRLHALANMAEIQGADHPRQLSFPLLPKLGAR